MISVGNSTMTITTLILLLTTGIVAVTAVDNQINIASCCELSFFNFTFVRGGADIPGVYLLNNFCGYDHIKAAAYCENSNQWRKRMASGPKEARWIC